MLTNSGLLLDHFARLATDVAGTSAAVVGVLGRRKDRGLRHSAFGLSPEQSIAVMQIDQILHSGPDVTVVEDLTLDHRFADQVTAFGHPGLRFLAYMRLLSTGGQPVGFICLLDEQPRAGLTPPQLALLGHVASMVITDRQREQRHLHLMHVADRALRVDRMLRLVSDAVTCADALTNLLKALCQFHGASAGQIWQMKQPDEPLQEISRYNQSAPAGGAQQIEPSVALLKMTAEAIRLNAPHAIDLSRLAPEDPQNAMAGSSRQVCVPIWVQQQRFGISLTFDTENPDLDAVMTDISSLADTIRPTLFQKVTEERMRFAAHHDDLTQLSNRLMFQQRLRREIVTARSSGQGFALLYLDLDGFKLINDTYGHEMGDRLLVGIAQRLGDSVREVDTVARMGGDEFAIIQSFDSQHFAAISLAKRLIENISKPFDLAGRNTFVGASIGIALYPQHGDNPDILLRNADKALYLAKNAGRKTYRVFDPSLEVNQPAHFPVEQDLRDAIYLKDFTLAYQPVCDSQSLRIIGFEALLRWNNSRIGPIQPDRFIPLAENSGLIVPLGRWALEAACVEAAKWDAAIFLSVNLSPLQFLQPDLPQQIADVLSRTRLPATRLQLEVTEGLLLDESELVLQTMRGLQQQGIRIILDDFGTAYASLSYLTQFPFDGIKIDKSFVRDLCDNKINQAIVHAILSLGDRLNLAVVAEGVETEFELETLRKLGCRLIQGYLSGRPAESQHARALLAAPLQIAGHIQ